MTKAARKDIEAELPEVPLEVPEDVSSETPMEDVEQQPTTPSWFSRTYGEQQPDDMAEQYRTQRQTPERSYAAQMAEREAAYEAYRRRLEERFVMAQRLADPGHEAPYAQAHVYNNPFPQRPYVASRFAEPTRNAAPKRARPLGVSPATLAFMTLTACSLGGLGGFAISNPGNTTSFMQSGMAFMGSIWSEPAKLPTETIVAKKPVHSARIEVRDASGAINSPIPLDITAYPADRETPVALRITGLPDAAYLTKGTEVAKGEWVLKANDIKQAELIVPRTDSAEIALQVSAMEERTGEPAAPTQNLRVELDTAAVPVPGVPRPQVIEARIEPANAVPNQQENLPPAIQVPEPLQSLNPEAQGFMAKGDRLLNTGDVLAARQFYLKAFNLNVAAAAFGVGQTYDPAVYAKFKIRGLQPDPEKAAEWYGKAAAGGHQEATFALQQLPPQP
jgi:hypothetical protein